MGVCGSMEQIAEWFASTLGEVISPHLTVFIISMIPILELRGGLVASSLLGVPMWEAIPVCIVGNLLPIPFILLLVRKVFHWMRKKHFCEKLVNRLERSASRKSRTIEEAGFWGLMLFVGIPLPGTGAWTGSLIAALLRMDVKKAILAELLGLVLATFIMSVISYGVLGQLF